MWWRTTTWKSRSRPSSKCLDLQYLYGYIHDLYFTGKQSHCSQLSTTWAVTAPAMYSTLSELRAYQKSSHSAHAWTSMHLANGQGRTTGAQRCEVMPSKEKWMATQRLHEARESKVTLARDLMTKQARLICIWKMQTAHWSIQIKLLTWVGRCACSGGPLMKMDWHHQPSARWCWRHWSIFRGWCSWTKPMNSFYSAMMVSGSSRSGIQGHTLPGITTGLVSLRWRRMQRVMGKKARSFLTRHKLLHVWNKLKWSGLCFWQFWHWLPEHGQQRKRRINTSDPVNQDKDDTTEKEGAGDNTNDTREWGTAHSNNGSEPTDLVCETHSVHEMWQNWLYFQVTDTCNTSTSVSNDPLYVDGIWMWTWLTCHSALPHWDQHLSQQVSYSYTRLV